MPYPVTLKVFNEAIDIEEYEHTIPCLSQKKSNITYYVEIYNNSTVFSARCGPLYIKGSNFSTNQYEVLHKNTVINQVYNLNRSDNSEFVFLSIIDVDNNEIVEKKLIPNIGIAQITLSESYNFNRGIITVQSINTVEPANSYDVACDMFIKAFYLEKKTTPILFNTSKCSNITNLQYQSKEADIPYTMIFTPTEIPTFVVLNNDTTTLDSQETKEVETDPVVIVAIVSSLIVIALVGALVTIIKIRKNKAREVTEYFEADADTKETDFSQISVI